DLIGMPMYGGLEQRVQLRIIEGMGSSAASSLSWQQQRNAADLDVFVLSQLRDDLLESLMEGQDGLRFEQRGMVVPSDPHPIRMFNGIDDEFKILEEFWRLFQLVLQAVEQRGAVVQPYAGIQYHRNQCGSAFISGDIQLWQQGTERYFLVTECFQ